MLQNSRIEFLRSAGGRWFLNAKLLLLSVPLVITTSLLSTGAPSRQLGVPIVESNAFYFTLVIANIFSLTLCALVVIGAAATVFSKRDLKPVPLWLVILFSAGIGALKGAGTGLASWFLGLEPDLSFAITSRVWQTTLLGAWLLPAFSLVAARLETLQIQRDALVAERVNATLLETGLAQNELNRTALAAFSAMAKNQLLKLTGPSASVKPNQDYAGVIRKLVSEQLRPLSHSIWEQENKRLSNFSLADAARNAVYQFTKPRALVAAIYGVTAIPSILRFASIDGALLRAFAASLCIYIGLLIASLIRPVKYWQATLWFFTVSLLISIAGFYSGEILFGYIEGFRPVETILAIWIWLTQLTFMSAFLTGVRKSREDLKAELTSIYGAESLEKAARFAHARIQNRDFANYLHGNVQNKLLSVALGLERGEATKQELENALKMVEEILHNIDQNIDLATNADLEVAMQNQVKQWAGFVAITWKVSADASNLPVRLKTLVLQVIDEAIANAVRHGLSKNVFVTIDTDATSNSVSIQVTDDGLGPRNGKPGLGTSFFKNVSNGNWSLQQQPNGGSKLTVNF